MPQTEQQNPVLSSVPAPLQGALMPCPEAEKFGALFKNAVRERLPMRTAFQRQVISALNDGMPSALNVLGSTPPVNEDALMERLNEALTAAFEHKARPVFLSFFRQSEIKIPDTEKGLEVKAILRDGEKCIKSLLVHQLGKLEILKTEAPAVWMDLLRGAGELQVFKAEVLAAWLKRTDRPRYSDEASLELLSKAAVSLGRPINRAYLKQVHLSMLPGGSSETPLSKTVGADFVYDYAGATGVGLMPYADVFRREFRALPRAFSKLSQLTNGLPMRDREALAESISFLSFAMFTLNSDPAFLEKIWRLHGGDVLRRQLQSGSSVMIKWQDTATVAGDANKVDVEIRLGLRTERTRRMEGRVGRQIRIVDNLNREYQEALSCPARSPEVALNLQPFAFGPNIHWMTRGESTTGGILLHVDAIEAVAKGEDSPRLKTLMPESHVSHSELLEMAAQSVALHELGHSVLSADDVAIKERVGQGADKAIVEELKADTVGALILSKDIESLPPEERQRCIEVYVTSRILGLVRGILDKAPTGSGERYHFSSLLQFMTLLKEENIRIENNQVKVVSYENSLKTLAGLGAELLEKFYRAKSSSPADVSAYAAEIRALSSPLEK